MTHLKHSERRSEGHRRPRLSQRELVAASLLRSGDAPRKRWDERTRTEYRDRRG